MCKVTVAFAITQLQIVKPPRSLNSVKWFENTVDIPRWACWQRCSSRHLPFDLRQVQCCCHQCFTRCSLLVHCWKLKPNGTCAKINDNFGVRCCEINSKLFLMATFFFLVEGRDPYLVYSCVWQGTLLPLFKKEYLLPFATISFVGIVRNLQDETSNPTSVF